MRLPHWTFYVDEMKEPFVGRAFGPLIFIRKDWKEDKKLWLHEYEHVKQFYMTLFLHGLLYTFFRKYRIWAEARGYAAQTADDKSNLATMGRRMALPVYDLRLTKEECRQEILKYL